MGGGGLSLSENPGGMATGRQASPTAPASAPQPLPWLVCGTVHPGLVYQAEFLPFVQSQVAVWSQL